MLSAPDRCRASVSACPFLVACRLLCPNLSSLCMHLAVVSSLLEISGRAVAAEGGGDYRQDARIEGMSAVCASSRGFSSASRLLLALEAGRLECPPQCRTSSIAS